MLKKQNAVPKPVVPTLHKPCAFNPLGVDREMCMSLTRVPVRNAGCVKWQCASKWRLCPKCVESSLTLNRSADPITGLCDAHAHASAPGAVTPVAKPAPVSRYAPKATAAELAAPSLKKVDVQAALTAIAPESQSTSSESRVATDSVTTELAETPRKDAHAWKEKFVRAQKALAEGVEEQIDPAKIEPMPGQPRTHFDEASLANLADSIRLIGQLTPGIVRRSANGMYQLIDGERRWRAVQRTTHSYRAIVVDVSDTDVQFVLASVANFNRAGHTPLDISDSVHHMHEQLHIPMEEVAALLGVTAHWAYQMHGLQRLSPEVRALLDPTLPRRECLSITAAIQISKLSDAVGQLKLAREIIAREIPLGSLRQEVIRVAKTAGVEVRTRVIEPRKHRDAVFNTVRNLRTKATLLIQRITDEAGSAALSSVSREQIEKLRADLAHTNDLIAQGASALEKIQGSHR